MQTWKGSSPLQHRFTENSCHRSSPALLPGTVMFCLDPRCTYPLHMKFINAMICHGGTTELVQIYNQPHWRRSITWCKWANDNRACQKPGTERELHEGSFRVVSVGNIDILQSHAHVYTTVAEWSFHGVGPLYLSATCTSKHAYCIWEYLKIVCMPVLQTSCRIFYNVACAGSFKACPLWPRFGMHGYPI